MKIRGYAALGLIGLSFPVLDLLQRTVVAGWIRLRPSRRVPTLGRWIDGVRGWVVWCLEFVGGASIPMPERIVPSGPGTLIVMNHQSVLDILLIVASVRGGYPRIVTRARYGRFIPLISHMVRLYQYPTVDPRATADEVRRSLRELSEAAVESDVPIAIFPEGTRTRDGSVGRFRARGLEALLARRAWTVHLLVADGYWRTAKMKDFVRGMAHIDGSIEYLGAAAWDDPDADPRAFVAELQERLADGLEAVRAVGTLPTPATPGPTPETSGEPRG